MSAVGARFTRCRLQVSADRYETTVAMLLELPMVGWQEERADGGASSIVTFWMPDDDGGVALDEARMALTPLGELCCEPEPGGWLQEWRRFHRPVTVAGVVVRPPWWPPVPGALDMQIEAGMAFGTGSHVTTRLCLATLAAVPPGERGELLDAGTGSGVLALAAVRLGYASVRGFDNDAEAIAQAAANARRNGLRLELRVAGVDDQAVLLPANGTLVANITLSAVEVLGRRCAAALAAGEAAPHRVILSGLLEDQAAAAVAAFRGYRRRSIELGGEWACAALEAEAA